MDFIKSNGNNYGNLLSNSGLINSGIINSGTITGDAIVGGVPPKKSSSSRSSKNEVDNPTDGRIWDVALSYAGEQEDLVRRVAVLLQAEGLKTFFAPFQKDAYAGDDMIPYFYHIFRYQSRYVAAFVTEDYLRKDYTMFEADAARLNGTDGKSNRLIPIFFGDAKLPDLNPDMCRLRGDGLREAGLADMIVQTIRRRDGGESDG